MGGAQAADRTPGPRGHRQRGPRLPGTALRADRGEAASTLAVTAPEEFERLVHLAEDVCWITRSIVPGIGLKVSAVVPGSQRMTERVRPRNERARVERGLSHRRVHARRQRRPRVVLRSGARAGDPRHRRGLAAARRRGPGARPAPGRHGSRARAHRRGQRRGVRRLVSARPAWVGIRRAGDVIPGMDGRIIIHSGPARPYEVMCGPHQRAAAWAAPCGRAGPPTRTPPPGPSPRARSAWSPPTSTRRSAPWRASSRPPCRSTSSGTKRLGLSAYGLINEGREHTIWLGNPDAHLRPARLVPRRAGAGAVSGARAARRPRPLLGLRPGAPDGRRAPRPASRP